MFSVAESLGEVVWRRGEERRGEEGGRGKRVNISQKRANQPRRGLREREIRF